MREKGFVEIILLAGVLVVGISLFLIFKSKQITKDANQVYTKPNTSGSTVNWNTYVNERQGYSIKYPNNFFLTEKNGEIVIHSKIYQCETENTPPFLENIKIDASEVKIEIKLLTGKKYNDIWKSEFGFDLIGNNSGQIQNNYDGVEYYGGKRSYYFYQGAEMTFGRKAILIENNSTSALRINSWTPVLVYKCDKQLNMYKGVANQILSSIKFTN